MTTPVTTLVLVHGAWHGGWAWDRLAAEPALSGLRIDAVDLPGRDRGDVPSAADQHDLRAHVAWLRRHLERIEGPIVVCAHSYGGAVVGEAIAGLASVRAAVFVAAFVLEEGESCSDANPGAGASRLGPEVEGDYLVVESDVAAQLFYQDADPASASAAAARVTPEHLGTVTAPAGVAGWRGVPTTYVLTERDRALPADAQRRLAARTDAQVSLDSDHSPMLTHPAALAEVIREVVASVDAGDRIAPAAPDIAAARRYDAGSDDEVERVAE